MVWLINAKGLIEGTGNPLAPEASVIIKDDIIVYADSSKRIPPLSSPYKVIDLSNDYVLPGLINTHVHLTFSTGSNPRHDLLNESDEELVSRAARNAATLPKSGGTTVRDCGAPGTTTFRLRDVVRRDWRLQ